MADAGGNVGGRMPFMIGSDVWPGIAKLSEECGEVVQVIGKIIALAGAESYTHWDGSDVRERLLEEMADVTAAIQFVWAHNLLGERRAFDQRVEEKFHRFQQWHGEGKRNRPESGRRLEEFACDCDDEYRTSCTKTWCSQSGRGEKS